jgi:hypothetical protein
MAADAFNLLVATTRKPETAAIDAMMHNSRSAGLRVLSLATKRPPLRRQLRSVQSSAAVQHNESNRGLLTEEDAAKTLPKHAPDYTAMADYRTSYVGLGCESHANDGQNILAGAHPRRGRQ